MVSHANGGMIHVEERRGRGGEGKEGDVAELAAGARGVVTACLALPKSINPGKDGAELSTEGRARRLMPPLELHEVLGCAGGNIYCSSPSRCAAAQQVRG